MTTEHDEQHHITDGQESANNVKNEAEQGQETPASGDRVEELEAEVARLKDQLLRTLAEVENVRKRATREREEAQRYAGANFARDILNVADNLARALESASQVENDTVQQLVEGVKMTERELLAAFDKQGIRKMTPQGEAFDHNYHQAMFEVESANVAPGTIVQVLQSGYVMHDRLLRPAMVAVAKQGSGPEAGLSTDGKEDADNR
ncbi:MAG: nucleotide exchange factor GrpE [Holosporales bacterium]